MSSSPGGMQIPFYLAVALFGSSSWLSVNAIWMELSLFTQRLPEGWSLPSYLDITIQLACTAPLIMGVVRKARPRLLPASFKTDQHKSLAILLLLVFSTVCFALLALGWQWTAHIAGSERSTGLIVLTFFLSLVCALSNVLFMPYMARLHPSYLTAYFVGMGLSALVPSLVSLAQGTLNYECIGGAPHYIEARFPTSVYFSLLVLWMLAATAAFVLINWRPDCLRLPAICYSPARTTDDEGEGGVSEREPIRGDSALQGSGGEETSAMRHKWLMACLMLTCAQMNSVVPNVQVFAALSYSLLTYHLALTLSNMAQPLACFLPLWLKPRRLSAVVALTALSLVITSLLLTLAAQSPTPFLKHGTAWGWPALGSAISVSLSIASYFTNAYLRTLITSLISEEAGSHERSKESGKLFWCGVIMQLGSLLGALVMWPLVNVVKVFESAPLC